MPNIIVINRHIVRANKKNNTDTPPIRVSKGRYGKPTYYQEFEFNGKGKVIYNPQNPLPCGATCYIELDV